MQSGRGDPAPSWGRISPRATRSARAPRASDQSLFYYTHYTFYTYYLTGECSPLNLGTARVGPTHWPFSPVQLFGTGLWTRITGRRCPSLRPVQPGGYRVLSGPVARSGPAGGYRGRHVHRRGDQPLDRTLCSKFAHSGRRTTMLQVCTDHPAGPDAVPKGAEVRGRIGAKYDSPERSLVMIIYTGRLISCNIISCDT